MSVAAIVIALASVLFTWQQKEIAKAALDLERQKHADERKPTLIPEIEEVTGGNAAWYRLCLRLDSPWTLAKLYVSIIEGKGLSFSGSQLGVDPAEPHPILTATGGPLEPGEKLTWRVDVADDREETARLRVQCSDVEERQWTIVIDVSAPYDALKSIY